MTTLHRARFADLDARMFHDLVRLRVEVFVAEQQCAYADLDGHDIEPGTWHVWAAGSNASGDLSVAGYLRLLTERADRFRIGRVCVAKPHRGAGLAGELVAEGVRLANQASPSADVVLDAQAHLVRWYEQRGFVVAGDEFLEDGIPHVPMRLRRY